MSASNKIHVDLCKGYIYDKEKLWIHCELHILSCMKNCELNASNFIKLCRCCSWYFFFKFAACMHACMRAISFMFCSIEWIINIESVHIWWNKVQVHSSCNRSTAYRSRYIRSYKLRDAFWNQIHCAEHSVSVLFKCVSIFIPFVFCRHVHCKHTMHSSKMHSAMMLFFNLILKKLTHTHTKSYVSLMLKLVCVCASPWIMVDKLDRTNTYAHSSSVSYICARNCARTHKYAMKKNNN